MVFTENTFKNCLSKLNEINAILFFQPNFGLAVNMAEQIKQNFEHDEVVVLDFQDIEKTFIQTLQDNLCDGFFATKKIIKVYNFKPNGKSKLKDEIKFLNEQKFNDKIVLFFAPELDGKSTFKTIFEKGSLTASIACYEDDEKTANQYINDYFSERNIKIQPNAIKIMAEMLHGDRQLLKSECEKIILYCNNNEITEDDINNMVINEQSANPISFADNLLSGNIKQAIKEFNLLEKEDTQIILICRSFIRSVEEIMSIKQQILNGTNEEIAIKSKFLFWKRIPLVKKSVQILTMKALENYIKISLQTEKMSKIYGNDIAKQYFIRNAILFNIK